MLNSCLYYFHTTFILFTLFTAMHKKILVQVGDNVQGDPIWAAPHLFGAWPHARIVFSGLVQLCSGKVRKLSHHILGGVHPSGGLVGVFHIKVDNVPTLKSLTQQSTLPFHIPVVLQPNLSSVSSHHGCSVHYPLASMG